MKGHPCHLGTALIPPWSRIKALVLPSFSPLLPQVFPDTKRTHLQALQAEGRVALGGVLWLINK